jgi:hypothetical protein
VTAGFCNFTAAGRQRGCTKPETVHSGQPSEEWHKGTAQISFGKDRRRSEIASGIFSGSLHSGTVEDFPLPPPSGLTFVTPFTLDTPGADPARVRDQRYDNTYTRDALFIIRNRTLSLYVAQFMFTPEPP